MYSRGDYKKHKNSNTRRSTCTCTCIVGNTVIVPSQYQGFHQKSIKVLDMMGVWSIFYTVDTCI